MKIMRGIIVAVAALSLTACQGLAGLLPPNMAAPPAPLAKTVIDDQAVNFALESFDAALTLVDAAIATGRIKAGSPQAVKLAGLIRTTMRFLGAADAAQRAGQAESYADAFRQARAALAEFRAALTEARVAIDFPLYQGDIPAAGENWEARDQVARELVAAARETI